MLKNTLFVCFLLLTFMGSSQDYFPENHGIKATAKTPILLTNAHIQTDAHTLLKNASLLIQEGQILEVGKNLKAPKEAVEIDMNEQYIYPSFVEVYSDFAMEKVKSASSGKQYEANRKGYYWNDHIRAEQEAKNHFSFDEAEAKKLRELGYGVVNTHLQDGVVRGSGMLVALQELENKNKTIIAPKTAQYYGFSRSKQSRQSYPSSIMGIMALMRQLNYDAQWYADGNISETDLALEAYLENLSLPQIIHAGNYLNVLRSADVAELFDFDFIPIGGGDEYKRIDEIKKAFNQIILPLNFPDAYDVEDPYMANYVSLAEMKDWQHAPRNPKYLAEAGMEISFTMEGLKDASKLMENIRTAIEKGLPKETALQALTENPSKILGLENKIGKLQSGALANFIVTSGELFEKETKIYENWIQGHRNVITEAPLTNLEGKYELAFEDHQLNIEIKSKSGKLQLEAKKDSLKLGTKIDFKQNWLTFMLTETDSASTKMNRFAALITSVEDEFSGKVFTHEGEVVSFLAKRLSAEDEDENSEEKEEDSEENSEEKSDKEEYLSPITYPNMAFGMPSPNETSGEYLIKNATVITSADAGTLENHDVWVKNSKIHKIGQNLKAKKAEVIDATGQFLTAGIIDEHSHIAASSVNEGGSNSSAETTMEDVINPDDISVYRSLAGGVTTTQLLHGSANPIGGRSAIIKMKWGASPRDMIIEDSPKFIKFALGENVKQSNWGGRERFPQTRMGVEQVYMDYFSRAKEYEKQKASGKYRYDEEMEVLLEIINEERFISCHSYVQSEINMLMKVAEQFDFKVNTFTHILEGYKVADKMKEHGAGASTFSDWWAYKNEVKDAIPYNATLMLNQGLTVAINSDDGEMIRRLNQEAAKSLKYGEIPAEEAWKFVTINPAKLLHIDDQVGSIEEGKHADLVLWNQHPLSMYAKAQMTMVEGVIYFSIEKDLEQREAVKKERNQLIAEMLKAKNKGMKTQAVVKKKERHMHCDTLDDFLFENFSEAHSHSHQH
ncbi:MAG: amidohydrolase family protein [Flavobacteriaceae bacterium]|nr:amidohydrolase family protein [Flavobacteriaceae bacterium]